MNMFGLTFKRTKLFYRLLIVLVVSVSVPVLLLGYLSYERAADQIEEVAGAFLADNANQNAQRIERFLREAERRSEAVIASEELQELMQSPAPESISDELEFIQVMNRLIAELKGPFELYVFPMAIDLYPNYNNLLQYRQVQPTEDMFAEAERLQGKGYWAHEWNSRWEAPDFIYVRQLRSLDHFAPVGVMAIRIPDSLLRDELIGPSMYPEAELIIADQTGAALSHPDSPRYGESLIASGPEGEMIRASFDLSNVDWSVSVQLPKRSVTASLDAVKRFVVWIVGISLLLITILLFLIARSFTNPIKKIISAMRKIKLGLLEPLPEHTRQDEIGQWIGGYNAMITSLVEQMSTIRSMEREKKDLERQMLILQINPHFLYNTLDSIKWKAQAIDEPVIAEMVTRLANMLRFSLSDGDGWTTVERELEHVKNYVAIEQLRNPGQFKVLFDIAPELQGAVMLQLLLQPLVENAIRHGMNKKKDRSGKIIVSAHAQGDDIVFTVEDNGPGASSGKPGGIGLGNVERRLRLHFGDAYAPRIHSSDAGFKVSVMHPMLRDTH